MAAHYPVSPLSSRSPSPDAYNDRYDPHDRSRSQEPVEMSRLPPQHSRSSSTDDIGLLGYQQRSQFPQDASSSRYTALPERSASQEPSPHRHKDETSLFSGFTLASLNPYKTKDVHAQALLDRRAGELVQWHIHWTTPASIAALYVAGVIAAVGHHLFYKKLDGQPADNQLLMIRYGTALAFFVKSTLVGTVILCYRQRIWYTFRKKAMTISAIDGLFAATEDPTSFLNLEMVRNGKLATLMALCSWLIPIASVLSPASLTSELRTTYNQTTCPSVASLNFSHEALYNFREESPYPGFSLAFYNSTDVSAKQEGWFDYYDQPSKNARRLAVTAAYLKKPASYPDASLDSCGQGWNCTYEINFQAPGYKCEEIANSSYPVPDDKAAPFNTSLLAPVGNSLYKASVDLNDYANPQVDTGEDGMPAEGPPYPDHLGVFQSEPVLWIGYAINQTDKPYPDGDKFKDKWKTVHEPKIFKCVSHFTNYTFEMRYNDTNQITKRKDREFLEPLVDTTVTINPENTSEYIASPDSNYVRPNADPNHYKVTAAYHSMNALLRNFLRGEIFYTQPYYVTKSDISETRLLDGQTSYAVPNLMGQVQELMEDMLITLLSEHHLVISSTQDVSCEKSKTINVYIYHRRGLWIGYAIIVVIAFLFILTAAWSIHLNGVASDTQFSRIMVTTRNPTLDKLSVGACLGGDPFPKELRETKLRFGVLLEDDVREGPLGRVEHCTFGAVGETKEIQKYGVYAGLKKYREGEAEKGTAQEKEGLLEKMS